MSAIRAWNVVRVVLVVASLTALLGPAPARDDTEDFDGAILPLTALSDGGTVTVAVKEGSVFLYRVDNTGKKQPARVNPSVSRPRSLAISPDGKFAVIGGGRKTLAVVSLTPRPTVLASCELDVALDAVAISSDGKIVAAGGRESNKVYLIDATSGKELQTLKLDVKQIWALRFSPDGKTLAVGTDDGKCRLWSVDVLRPGKLLWEERIKKGEISCITFFPCGKKLATGSLDGTVSVLDARTGKTQASYLAHRWTVHHVAVSQDGKYVGSCGTDCSINVWDAENEKNVATEKIKWGFAALAFSKTHLLIAEGTTLRTFDLKTKKLSEFSK